ncbi:MAG: ribulose-phosphate 3-epimerase [Thermoplasmata archaeon]|nr:MAG: ribulose-phosphate 3-epimerase [Thermoplasmata archaeon]
MIEISPSVLSANFSCIKEEIESAERGGAGSFHIDVMDGHFVPNITMGPVIVRGIRECTAKRLDSHLMICKPKKYAERFVDAGSDVLLLHVESDIDISLIKKIGKMCGVGVVLNPSTPLEKAKEYFEFIDYLLVMSVNPGFSGQKFMDEVIPKIKKSREYAEDYGFKVMVDGGINKSNIARVVDAGAQIIVAASAVFRGEPEENVRTLLNIAAGVSTK